MEPSAEGDSRQENVSGEGLNSPAPKPQVSKKGSPAPKTATTRAAGRIRAKALASRKAPKAEEEKEEEALHREAAEAEGEAEPRRQESPPVDEPGSSRAFQPQPLQPPPEVLQTASLTTQSGSPGGAREELSQPQLPMIEDNELLSLPSVSTLLSQERAGEPAPKRAKLTSEVTFTPSAAGVRPKETQEPEISPRMRLIISEAIVQGIVAGIQQRTTYNIQKRQASPAPESTLLPGQPTAPNNSRDSPVLQRPHYPSSSIHIRKYFWNDEEQTELMLSENEGGAPDRPAFTGLFNPALFKTLLYKAKATAQIGADPATSDPSLGLSDPNSVVFSEPANDKEEIPTAKLFLDVVQREWAQPGGNPSPSGMEKQFYNVAPNLTAALEIPTIDEPVAALASPTVLSNDTEDALKGEDKKAEVTLRKNHHAAAWAVKSATAASFFNRTSLLWLKQMEARIPATDLHSHQDIKKLIEAAEFSADATLNSAKFASRAIALSVTVRRLLWLRHWRADMTDKWKLASAPYKGDKLFGEALEPLLMETKDNKKVLPRYDMKSYFERPSAHDFSQPQPYHQQQDSQSDRPSNGGKSRQ